MAKKIYALIIIMHTFYLLAAQGTLRGVIFDKENGQPIPFAEVRLNTETITSSDVNGFYVLSSIPSGSYSVKVVYVGYEELETSVEIKDKDITNQTFYLAPLSLELQEVNVAANRYIARTQVEIAKVSVTAKEIKALPSIGGESDIAQYLQMVPGIVSTGDQGGQLYVRGGAPVQNKILLDGLNIYNPFHSLGLFSVFETDLIRNVDIHTAGFGAQFGGRTSAVIDINTREPNKSALSGYASASPFMVKALIESPLSKFEEGKGSTSLVLSGKKSIIQNTAPSLYSHAITNDSVGMPFSFQDIYGKLSVVSNGGSKFNIFGFNFTDSYENPAVANIGWKNVGVGADFTMIPNNSSIIVNGIVGFTNYDLGINNDIDDKRNSSIQEFGAAVDFSLFGKQSEINYGFDLKAVKTDFTFLNPYRVLLNQNQNNTEFSGFVKYKQILGKFIFEPSVRLMYYASQAQFSPEPRLGFKYNISSKLRLKGGGGFYSQNILSASNERDVVNLFYGFLSSPESRVNGLDGKTLSNNLQLAKHGVFGVEADLGSKVTLNLEAYHKDFNQILVVNRNKLKVDDSDYAEEEGRASGIDLAIHFKTKKLTSTAGYSYAKVDRNDGSQVYATIFDRRHNLNYLLVYQVDTKGTFQISARWNMGSGFPFTKTQGFYNQVRFVEGPTQDYLTDNPAQIGIIYSSLRNGGRLPYYHRLDVSATKKWHLKSKSFVELTGSVTNAYDRKNIFYFDRIRYNRVNQLPIIPALALKVGF
jgi:hypothetical protein